MNATVRNITIAQRLSLGLNALAWTAQVSGPAMARAFSHRYFLEALRSLPDARDDGAAITAWIGGPLRRFFPFVRCAGFYGDFTPGRLAIQHRLAVGFEEAELQRIETAFFLTPGGCFAHWLETRRPLIIDCARPPACAKPGDVALFEANRPGSIAAHGVVNPLTSTGLFFGFSGVDLPLGQAHAEALQLIVPILNDLQLDLLAAETRRKDRLAGLSPRQREIARLIVAGEDNGGIATAMGLSQKTVRNIVSEIYSRLGVGSRAGLIALVRR